MENTGKKGFVLTNKAMQLRKEGIEARREYEKKKLRTPDEDFERLKRANGGEPETKET